MVETIAAKRPLIYVRDGSQKYIHTYIHTYFIDFPKGLFKDNT